MTALERLNLYADEVRERGLEGDALVEELVAAGRLQPVDCPECAGAGCAACDGFGVVFTVGDDG